MDYVQVKKRGGVGNRKIKEGEIQQSNMLQRLKTCQQLLLEVIKICRVCK